MSHQEPQLLNAAKSLCEKLRLIHEDSRYVTVFTLAAMHGTPYTGPNYEEELRALETIVNELSQ